MDGDHRLGATQLGPDAVGHVVQRVLVLGEHDQLARAGGDGDAAGLVGSVAVAACAVAGGGPAEVALAQQVAEFDPLRVGAAGSDLLGQRHQPPQLLHLGLEFLRGGRRSCGVDEHVLQFLELGVVVLVGVEVLQVREPDTLGEVDDRHGFAGGGEAAQLGGLRVETLAAAAQRVIDRRRGGRQAPLQAREGEPDDDPPPAVRSVGIRHVRRLGHAGAHVVRDGLVQLVLRLGQLELDAVRRPLGEQPLPLERAEVLLHQPAHHIAHIRHRASTEPAGEPIRVH